MQAIVQFGTKQMAHSLKEGVRYVGDFEVRECL